MKLEFKPQVKVFRDFITIILLIAIFIVTLLRLNTQKQQLELNVLRLCVTLGGYYHSDIHRCMAKK